MHVYPHPGLPLLPRLLVPALADQIIQIEGVAAPTPLNLSKREFCSQLTSDQHRAAAESISSLVQKVCYGRVRQKSWSAARINVPTTLRLGDLNLTDRAQVSLQHHEFFSNDSQWRTASIDEIIGPRGEHRIGARLMLALLLAAEHANEQHSTDRPSVAALEDEIEQAVRAVIHSPRTANIYLEMNGWTGVGVRGLNDIAESLQITHERARQIGVAGAASMLASKTDPQAMPILGSALKVIADIAPCLVDHANAVLRAKKFARGEIDVAALLQAAERFGFGAEYTLTRVDGQDFVANTQESIHLAGARHVTRKALRASGILSVEELLNRCDEAALRITPQLTAERVRRLTEAALFTMPGWSFLDSDRSWATVTLGTDGEELHPRGPVARIARMAHFFRGIALSTAQNVLSHQDQHWPPEILVALCLRMGLTVRPMQADWWIEARDEVASRVENAMNSTAELDMALMLREAGGSLTRAETMERAEARGIHRSTALACMKTASLFITENGRCSLSVAEFEDDTAASTEAEEAALA